VVGGRVYLLDLALDETNETVDSQPASLTVINPAARRDIPGYDLGGITQGVTIVYIRCC
jgi:hypothetical protein